MSNAPQTSREWHSEYLDSQETIKGLRAENQALAEALQACLPLVDDAEENCLAEEIDSLDLNRPDTAARHKAIGERFRLQAEHIRSLLGLSQP